MARNNPVTTHRINNTVYDLRHWKMTLVVGLVVMPPMLLARALSGRNMWRGGRSTDATFFRGAREERKGWWNDKPGAARAGCRITVIVGLWAWTVVPVVVYVLAGLEVVVLVACGVRKYRDIQHEKKVIRPVWPAVAGIIGIPETQPPTRWVDIPRSVHTHPDRADAVITVGLRAADAEDERRVAALVQLFDQRYGPRPHYGWVDYAARLVHIKPRPEEPQVWPAVANVLGISHSQLAHQWLELPAEPVEPGSKVTVALPSDVWDHDPMRTNLARVVNQNFPGEWESTVHLADPAKQLPKRVVVTRKQPPRTPPQQVDFLAEHPDYQEMN